MLVLPFPSGTLTAELFLLAFLVLLEFTRIFTGWKANLTESVGGMGICVALYVPGILGVLYFLIWQVSRLYISTKLSISIKKPFISGLYSTSRNGPLWRSINHPRLAIDLFSHLFDFILRRNLLK